MDQTRVENRRAPAPALLVALELLRALGGLLLLPWRGLRYWSRREELRAEVRGDLLASPLLFDAKVPLERLAARREPLRIFVSCAEASGELHAKNLVRALRRLLAEAGAPPPVVSGLGGAALREEGVELVADPVSRAAMGFGGVLAALPFYLRLVRDVARHFARERIDLFLPVDSPALHVPLGRVAKACGVPAVVHFVTPQYWGWAPWRARGYARAVDLALSILPFEPPWFERRGVPVAHVGHPLLDEIPPRELAPPREDGPLVLLPGSRRSVVSRNLPVMLEALRRLREEEALDREVVVAQGDERHRALLEGLIERAGVASRIALRCGDLEGTLAEATVALSVSGTILLHLLQHRLPAVVLYRLEHRGEEWLSRHFLTTPWFSSVNLLAGAEVYPELAFAAETPPPRLVDALRRALRDAAWRAQCRRALEDAATRLGPPGATSRAAAAALCRLEGADSNA